MNSGMLEPSVINNLMVLAAHALNGKTFQAEPEQMAELWGHVSKAKQFLLAQKESAERGVQNESA